MNPPTGSSASDAPPTAATPAMENQVSVLDLENLAPGSCWRGVYPIGEQLPDVTYGRIFKGLNNDVIIRSFRVSDGLRARTWEDIKRAQNGRLLELIEAIEDHGRRVEVIQAPLAVTLREWAAQRKVSQTEIELVVRQLSEALGSLHKQGVVHLNVRPDTVFVSPTEGGLDVYLGGFETATLLQADGPVEVSMDPFYAPPEALGLYHYTREPGLRAWDWWSLGRVIQEALLGRHILGHILERDVTRETPELRARAENLLKEEDHVMHAGAVEMMPAMDRELMVLLRGLLTGSRDGRWGLAEVESWLKKEPVKDRYSLSRHERLFIWNDRAFTVAEAAEFFTRVDHWHEGLMNLFEPTNPSTLGYFLGTTNAHKKTSERVDLMMKLGEVAALRQLPPEIARDVVLAVVLKFLAGYQAPLVLRGRRIDETCLKALLKPEAQPTGLGLVYGLTARPVVQQIEQSDSLMGRMLGELERIYGAAAEIALQNHWLSAVDAVGLAALMGLCLEPEISLNATRVEMLKLYACSRDRALDKIFKKRDANQAELAVIAFTNLDPAKGGYVTHKEWNEEQHRMLRQRGEQLAAAGLWLNLGHALKLGPLVFGRWRLFLPVWALLAATVAFVGQNFWAYSIAWACPSAALVVRIIWFGFHRARLQHRLRGSRPWTLSSGVARCGEEALAALKADSAPGPRALLSLLRETNDEMVKLTLDPAPKPVPRPPGFRDTQAVSLVSWLLVLALLAGTVWYGVRHPPKIPPIKWDWVTQLWASSPEGQNAHKTKLSVDQAPDVGVKSIQTTLEELRRAKREADKQAEHQIKISWPFKPPSEPQVVRLRETSVALPEQAAVAEEMAKLLVDRYDPKTINAIIAVQVPTEKGVGLMLYNGRTGKMAARKVYTINFVPFARSWIAIDDNTAIFLGGL